MHTLTGKNADLQRRRTIPGYQRPTSRGTASKAEDLAPRLATRRPRGG